MQTSLWISNFCAADFYARRRDFVCRRSFSAIALMLVATACACGTSAHSASGLGSSLGMSSSRGEMVGSAADFIALRQAEFDGALVVAPDRAQLQVTVRSQIEGTPAMATTALMNWIERFRKDVERAPGCKVHLSDLGLAVANSSEISRRNATLVVEVLLLGQPSVEARAKQLGGCATRVAKFIGGARRSKRRVLGTFASSAREWRLTIDRPRSHLPELLRRAAERFKPISDVALPSQFRPLDRRCVPTGEVVIRARTLGGMWLEAELLCDVVDSHSVSAQSAIP